MSTVRLLGRTGRGNDDGLDALGGLSRIRGIPIPDGMPLLSLMAQTFLKSTFLGPHCFHLFFSRA